MKVKKSKVNNYLSNLADALYAYLPDDWERKNYPDLRSVKPFEWGNGGIFISTTYKGFPSSNLYLNYGVSHNVLTPILDKISIADGHEPVQTINQFGTDTRNNRLNPYFTTVFVEDYSICNYDDAVSRLMEDSLDNLHNFFEKFSSLIEIRESLVNQDGKIFSIGRAANIVAIDYVLSDFEHLFWFRYEKAKSHEIDRIEQVAQILGIKL